MDLSKNFKTDGQQKKSEMLMKQEQTYRWQKKIEKQLCVKKIVAVRYMTPEEAESSYWTYQPILLILDDGTAICPMSDDEGNEAGSIACMGEKVEVETIPVMRERI